MRELIQSITYHGLWFLLIAGVIVGTVIVVLCLVFGDKEVGAKNPWN